MARYRGAVCRICRREGTKLFLKGARCYTDKCALEHREAPPGELPKRGRKRASGYLIHLREKQKVKRIYGVQEAQFRRYYELASRKKGVTGEVLLQLLERRLDNVVYRAGFASSRKKARQLVAHGHFEVNGHKVDIPSYLVKPGDKIASRDKSVVEEELKRAHEVPAWILFDKAECKAEVVSLPKRTEISQDIREELIIELYSK